jgi:prepilin-type N-terminal cleavage/methylation domain-containing protein
MMKLTEKGFTLIELLVALSISGAIMGVMSQAVILIMSTTQQNEEWNMNVREVQNVGHWISEDALMAQTVTTTNPGVFPLSLTWSDWNATPSTVQYYFNGNALYRQLNGVAPGILVAEYVVTDPTHTNCTWNAATNTLTVNIRTSLHGNNRFADGTYQVHPRPSVRGG